jgi:hypothetical protein
MFFFSLRETSQSDEDTMCENHSCQQNISSCNILYDFNATCFSSYTKSQHDFIGCFIYLIRPSCVWAETCCIKIMQHTKNIYWLLLSLHFIFSFLLTKQCFNCQLHTLLSTALGQISGTYILQIRGAQIPGARSPWRLNFYCGLFIFVNTAY